MFASGVSCMLEGSEYGYQFYLVGRDPRSDPPSLRSSSTQESRSRFSIIADGAISVVSEGVRTCIRGYPA